MLVLSIFLLDQSQESGVSSARDHGFLQCRCRAERRQHIGRREPPSDRRLRRGVEEVQPVGIQGEAKPVAEPVASNATREVR
jgi:hypothetical protein